MKLSAFFKSLLFLSAMFSYETAFSQKNEKNEKKENQEKDKKEYDSEIVRKGQTYVSPLTTTIPRKAREKGSYRIAYTLKTGSDDYQYEITLNEVTLSPEGGYIFNQLPPDDKAYSYILLDNKTILGQKIVFKKAGEYQSYLTYTFSSAEASDARQFAVGFIGGVDESNPVKLVGITSGFKVRPAIYSKLVVQRPSAFKKNSLTFGSPSIISDLGYHYVSIPVENKSEHTLFLSGSYKYIPTIWKTKSSTVMKKGVPPYSKFNLRWPLAQIEWMEGDSTRLTFEIDEKNEGASYRKSSHVDVWAVKLYGSKARVELNSLSQSITAVDKSGQYLAWPVTIHNPTQKFVTVTSNTGELSPKDGGLLCNERIIAPRQIYKCNVYFKKPNAPALIKNLNMTITLNEGKDPSNLGPVLHQLKIERLQVVSAK